MAGESDLGLLLARLCASWESISRTESIFRDLSICYPSENPRLDVDAGLNYSVPNQQ